MIKRTLLYFSILMISLMFVGCQTDITTTTSSSSLTTSSTLTSTTNSSSISDVEFVVSFDTNGGSEVSSIHLDSSSAIDLPTSEKEGYSFEGWVLENTPEASVIASPFQVETSVILYAKWTINQYTINFQTNEGSSVNSLTQDYNSTVAEPLAPTKLGYVFSGWYLDSALTIPYTFSTMPPEDITLYAKWDEEDWSDIEEHLLNILPSVVSEDINLPTSYFDYSISWTSSAPEALSNEGVYHRPYQALTVQLTALIEIGDRSLSKNYDVEVVGYKSLSAPLASSYIYRDYYLVNSSFFSTLDIINCAFITANSAGTLSGTSVLSNINTYIMPMAREYGNWVLFSIAPDSDWSGIVSSTSRMNTFADNIVALINQYGFDGVDIDWETPTSSEALRFTQLMEIIYTKVKANNPNHLVTAAIAGGTWQPPYYDLENSAQYLDYINMMTYGMVNNNGYYQNALSKSTTYANPTYSVGKTLTSCSIEESVAIYNSYGIPNSKIIVGVAFYGIKQTRTYDSATQTWSSWTFAGSVSYSYIQNNYLNNSDYNYYYDSKAGVPYIISTDGTTFISFDNPRSIAAKSSYIIDSGLAGIMYWENGLDSTGSLLLAIEVGINDID